MEAQARFSTSCARDAGPVSTHSTAGCPSGNWIAAAAVGTPSLWQISAISAVLARISASTGR